MMKYKMTGTVTITMHYETKDGLVADYDALQMRFSHVKLKMLPKGDDITMDIKVEKVEENA